MENEMVIRCTIAIKVGRCIRVLFIYLLWIRSQMRFFHSYSFSYLFIPTFVNTTTFQKLFTVRSLHTEEFITPGNRRNQKVKPHKMLSNSHVYLKRTKKKTLLSRIQK